MVGHQLVHFLSTLHFLLFPFTRQLVTFCAALNSAGSTTRVTSSSSIHTLFSPILPSFPSSFFSSLFFHFCHPPFSSPLLLSLPPPHSPQCLCSDSYVWVERGLLLICAEWEKAVLAERGRAKFSLFGFSTDNKTFTCSVLHVQMNHKPHLV